MNRILLLLLLLLIAPMRSFSADNAPAMPVRTWQGIPGLECTPKGRVFVSWFTGGPKEPSPENTVLLAY
ncbi:MAG TPA: hypothetical protein VK968_03330, partial [Roseimicrobium sp.]|nr:hypothetical protein [Roseimicrobium sp.]